MRGAGLAEGLLVEVRGRLAVWLEEEARHGRYPGDDDQQAYCEALLEDALAGDASRRLTVGDTALTHQGKSRRSGSRSATGCSAPARCSRSWMAPGPTCWCRRN